VNIPFFEHIAGASMKKINWFLLIQLFSFSLVYSVTLDDLDKEYIYDPQTGESYPYAIISNVDEFNVFVEEAIINSSPKPPLNPHILLNNDIDLGYYFDGKECRLKKDSSISSFNPIPLVLGVFDGNNHTIRGLCVQVENGNAGLFSQKGGLIKNLKIDSAYIQGDVAGALLGESPKGVDTKFINVHVSNSTIIGTTTVGGLAGKQVTSIDSSSVTGTKLVLQSENESGDIGGLMGRFDVEEGSTNSSLNITSSFVKNNSFASSLSSQTPASPQNIGGLVGSIQSEAVDIWPTLSISNSFVETNISTVNQVNLGGLIGYFSLPDASVLITSSYFKGDIISSKTDDELSCFGGFVGSATNVTVDKSFQKGSIKTEAGLSVGGLIGQVTGNQNTIITNSYQKGSIQAEKAKYKGLFIGSNDAIDASLNIRSVYSVPDSGSSLEPVGYSKTTPSFSGFIANENGADDLKNLDNENKVKPDLLKQRSAAYLLNLPIEVSDIVSTELLPWTQNPDSNDGYPFFKPESYYPIYQVILINDIYNKDNLGSAPKTPPDTVYNSPLTGKIDPIVFDKYPPLEEGAGKDKYSFEEINEDFMFTGKSLTPETIIHGNATFRLTQATRYAIKYILNTENFVYWLTDSITDFSENHTLLEMPKIIKENSCFLGWTVSAEGTNVPTTPSLDIFYFDGFFDPDSFSDITLTAKWEYSPEGDYSNCPGIYSSNNTTVSVNTTNGLVSLRNKGRLLTPEAWGYSIPVVYDIDDKIFPVPIRVDVQAKPGYELASLYYIDLYSHNNNNNKRSFSSGYLLDGISSEINIFAEFKSTTEAADPLYTITYDVSTQDVNTPILFTSDSIIQKYSSKIDQSIQLPKLVQAYKNFNDWEITCKDTGTCTQYGYKTDSPFIENYTNEFEHGYSEIPSSFEGNIILKPIFEPIEKEERTLVQVEVKPIEHGYLTLSNANRLVLKGPGKILFPITEEYFQTNPDNNEQIEKMPPPLLIKPVADSSYEIKNITLNYTNNNNITSDSTIEDFSKPYLFNSDVSISANFFKTTLAFGPHSFIQRGGALSYSGSLSQVDTKDSFTQLTLMIQNKEETFKDSASFSICNKNDIGKIYSFEKINLPLGNLKFKALLKTANTTLSKEYDFFVDSSLQFKPSSWQMISLSNVSPAYKKSRDEIFFGWNDSTALGDFWQYEEFYFREKPNPFHGYWYQSLSETSIPLEVDYSSSVTSETVCDIWSYKCMGIASSLTPETKVSWDLISGETGWNLIANPFHWPISLNLSQDNDSIAFWKWNDSLGAYDRIYHLEANSAAWVQVSKNKTWETTAAPFFNSTETAAPKRRLAKKEITPKNWRIQLKLKNALGKEDAYNFIGVGAKASSLKEPPQGMGSFVNLSILKEKDKLAEQILSSNNSIWSFDILLSSSNGDKASLEMEGVQALLEMGYRVVLNKDGEIFEVKENTPIILSTKQDGSKATITVMPTEQFSLAQKIDNLSYYKQGSAWKIQFNAGIALDRSKAVLSLHNIKGKKLSHATANVNLGLNEFVINGADFSGIVIANITIYSENGKILYQHQQKLLEKR
jgi:hypothetical protein